MRFTILTQYYPPEVGAAQVRLSAFARELGRHGHHVQVVTAMPNYPAGIVQPPYQGKVFVREQVDGIPVTRTWIIPATGRSVVQRLANYFSFAFSSLVGLASVPRGDVLFVESPPLFVCLSGWIMSVLRREKLCINISDLWPDSVVALGMMGEGAPVQWARCLERWLYRHSWRISAATTGILDSILKKGIPRRKLLFLPNGVDLELFQQQELADFCCKPYQFLFAGTHGYAHGVEVILRAARLLKDRNNIRFLLVGDGADKPRLQGIRSRWELNNVVFLDPVPFREMPALLGQSYVALVTVAVGDFFSGTRSAKIFPSMAARRAIIHSGAGEGAHLVLESKAGIVTSPGDERELAAAITYLADNPSEAIAMGQRGRAFVEREYSWSCVVERWLKELDGADAKI